MTVSRPNRRPSSRPTKAAMPRGPLEGIGEIAKAFNVTLRTLRFYEDRGLLSPVRDGKSRFYGNDDKARLALILKGKSMGFTLGEISDLIASGGGFEDVQALSLKPDQIESQIDHLQRQRDDIDGAIGQLRAVLASLTGRPPGPANHP